MVAAGEEEWFEVGTCVWEPPRGLTGDGYRMRGWRWRHARGNWWGPVVVVVEEAKKNLGVVVAGADCNGVMWGSGGLVLSAVKIVVVIGQIGRVRIGHGMWRQGRWCRILCRSPGW